MAEPMTVCSKCFRDVTDTYEAGADRPGEYVCEKCRENPLGLLRGLVQEAARGNKDVCAIDGYEIIEELGRGGMGAVYLARTKDTERQVALKVMLPKVAASKRAADMFLREAVNTKALDHPNIVRLWDMGSSSGTFFFTLEYCSGGSLHELMKRRGGKLSIAEARPIILQALEGLHYAHDAEIPHVKLRDGSVGKGRGLVHRDLKPQNIFLSGSDDARVVKLGDYGLSKAFDMAGLSGHTYSDEVAGSPNFMSRQQVRRYKDLRPEADVWALAATLYCMLTGFVPRDCRQGQDRWQAILENDPIAIRQRDPTIPKKLAEVIDRALIEEPEIAVKSAAELKQALVQVMR